MKVCIREHVAPGFGTIPTGSLWADDSPYINDEDFVDVSDEKPKPVKKVAKVIAYDDSTREIDEVD